jgi:UvrD-like helicase C-terminal domain
LTQNDHFLFVFDFAPGTPRHGRVRRLRQFRPDREHRGRDAGDEKIPFPTDPNIQLASDIPDQPFVKTSLETAIEELAWDHLEEVLPGWEIDDGAYGTYVFDVADRAITLEHRARFTDVYNGDLGVVSRTSIKEGELIVDFDDREVAYAFGKLDEPVLADATTIHKSQGSEYPAVIIPLTTQHYPMLQRNRLSIPNVLISGLLYPMDGRARPELSGVGDLEGDVAIATRQRVLGRLRRLSFKNTAT